MSLMKIKRALERAGFVHVAGWVRADDFPRIMKTILEAQPEVDAIRAQNETGAELQTKVQTAPK